MDRKIGILMGMMVLLSLASLSKADLVMDCTLCGCPSGQVCDPYTKLCVDSCNDGTQYGACASSKPLYCDSGNLVSNCQECGCPSTVPDCQADGICKQAPVLSASVDSQYPYNSDIMIMVSTTNINQFETVSGKISTEGGQLIQEIGYGTWAGSNSVSFYFNPINNPGNFKFVAWFTKNIPPYDTVYSSEKTFSVKSPLTVTFTVTDPTQYTVEDMELRTKVLGPNGEILDFNRQLSAKIDGFPIDLGNVQWIDEGSGNWKAIVKKEYLRPGRMDITLTVSDPFGRYETVVKTLTGITVNKPAVGVSIIAPSSSKIGNAEEVKVSTSDLYGRPLEPDTIELKVTYPGSLVTKTFYRNAYQNDFQKVSEGVYKVFFQFADKEGGLYSWEAKATKENYFTGSAPKVTTTVKGGGITPTCDATDLCDPDCPDDPDCQTPIGIPWWVWPVLVIIIIAVLVMILRR
jgi:hypothetical protein